MQTAPEQHPVSTRHHSAVRHSALGKSLRLPAHSCTASTPFLGLQDCMLLVAAIVSMSGT